MTPKEKAEELIILNPNKEKLINSIIEIINNYKNFNMFYCSKKKILSNLYWLEVKKEIEKL